MPVMPHSLALSGKAGLLRRDVWASTDFIRLIFPRESRQRIEEFYRKRYAIVDQIAARMMEQALFDGEQ